MRFIQRRAFTLVELMVVIAIIGLLSTVAVISAGSAREKARVAAGQSFSAQIDRAVGDRVAGEWFLNEGSGTAASDGSGMGANGILQNGPTWSTDTPSGTGYALSLDGLNDYVQVADNPSLKYAGGDMTLAIWIKPGVAETDGSYVMSKPWNSSGVYNYYITANPDRTVTFAITGATAYSLTTSSTVPASRWSFVVATVSVSGSMRIYIDGSIKATGTHSIVSWTPPSGDSNLALCIGTLYPYGGSWGGRNDFSFAGLIDDPRVMDGALTALQVQKLYARGRPGHPSVLAFQ